MNEKQVSTNVRMRAREAAAHLGYTERTLANWRWRGVGPRFYKPRGFVMYYQHDLDAWLVAGGGAISTAQARAKANMRSVEGEGSGKPRPVPHLLRNVRGAQTSSEGAAEST